MSEREEKIKEICGVLFQSEEKYIPESKIDVLLQDMPDKIEFFKLLQKYLGILGLTLARIVKNEQKFYVLVSEGLHNQKNIDNYSLLALIKIYFDELGDNLPKSEIIELLGEHSMKLNEFIKEDYLVENGDKLSLGFNMKILFQKIPPPMLRKIIFDE